MVTQVVVIVLSFVFQDIYNRVLGKHLEKMEPPCENGQNGTAEEDPNKVNLNFSEVLYLLSKQAVLGPGIPEKYDTPPWRLSLSHPDHQNINMIVDQSMMVQSGTYNIPLWIIIKLT